MSSTPPFFSPGVGYALVVGLGAAFAIGMSLLSWGLSRYMAEVQTSEMYMTAKHSVKTGLVATAVVSSWTIAATLLSSTTGEFIIFFGGGWWRGWRGREGGNGERYIWDGWWDREKEEMLDRRECGDLWRI